MPVPQPPSPPLLQVLHVFFPPTSRGPCDPTPAHSQLVPESCPSIWCPPSWVRSKGLPRPSESRLLPPAQPSAPPKSGSHTGPPSGNLPVGLLPALSLTGPMVLGSLESLPPQILTWGRGPWHRRSSLWPLPPRVAVWSVRAGPTPDVGPQTGPHTQRTDEGRGKRQASPGGQRGTEVQVYDAGEPPRPEEASTPPSHT